MRDGAAHGPIAHSELCGLFATTELPVETPVRPEGTPDWVEASTVDDFRGVWGKAFGRRQNEPPPLPTPLRAAPAARPTSRPSARPSVDGEMAARPRRPDEDAPVPQSQPWTRFWARKVDYIVVPSAMLLAFAIFQPQYAITLGLLVLGVAFLHLMLVPMFGTTVGKGILGISIQTQDGGRPSAGQMFSRELSVLFFGQALGMSPFTFYTHRAAYRHLMEEGQSTWDQSRGLVVRHQRVGLPRAILAACVCLAAPIIGLSALATTQRANERARSESAYGAITFTGVRRSMAADGSPRGRPPYRPPPPPRRPPPQAPRRPPPPRPHDPARRQKEAQAQADHDGFPQGPPRRTPRIQTRRPQPPHPPRPLPESPTPL